MKLLTVDEGLRGTAGALLANGDVLRLGRAARAGTIEAWIPETLRELLEAGDAGLDVARGLIDRVESAAGPKRDELREIGAITSRAHTRLLSPIPNPRLIVGGGLNYRSHLAEMSGTPAPSRPTGFIMATGSITGPGPIKLPPHAAEMVDWEGEVACVIGKTCHNVSEADAMSHVAGYTVLNDVSARDWVAEVFAASSPWEARQSWELNLMGKQFAGFTAIGPVIATADEVGDPNDLTLVTRLNGEVVQDAHTSDLVFDFAASIAHFSRWYTFHPGDIVTTGTPAGVGVGRKPPRFMHAGDTIEVEVARVGLLTNTLVA